MLYKWGMKKIWAILVLLAGVSMCLPMEVRAEESASKQFFRGLVRKGAQAVQNKLDEQEQKAAQEQSADAKPRGGAHIKELFSPDVITRSVREVVMESLDAVKEQYMEEGRTYARQLGDSLAERIVHHPKVQSTIFIVKALAWVVGTYLTLVTVLLLLALRKLNATNRRILELIEERFPTAERRG